MLFNLDANNTSPAVSAAAVTPNDGADLTAVPTRALYIGVSGNLNVDMADGTTVAFANVPAGVFPLQVKRVRLTGTSASSIVALY